MQISLNNNILQVQLDSNYKDYQSCVTLYLLVDSNDNVKYSFVNLHSGIDECLFKDIADGWYRVYAIIIPKYESISKEINTLYKWNKLFCYKDGFIQEYLFRTNLLKDTDFKDLIKDTGTNITTNYKDIFVTDALNQALISYIKASNGQAKLESTLLPKCSDTKIIPEKSILEIRNYLNMILEMITYYTNCENFAKAEQLLSLVKNYCNVREIDS